MVKIKKIVLVHHTHTDIGYTGTYPEVAVQHVRHLRSVLKMCQSNRQFRWTMESSWPLEIFLSVASSSERNELAELIRKGRIELTGFYNQPLTQLCNLEELCASIELTCHLSSGLNAVIDTLIIDDIGGLSYNIPQIARYYGIKYIVNGCGGWRVMLPFTTLPHLFYLTGPDGSRILYYHIGDDVKKREKGLGSAQYGFGILYFLWPVLKEIDGQPTLFGNDGEKTIFDLKGREGIDQLCSRLEREGYPFDTILVQTGGDNEGPEERLLETVKFWNKHYRFPEIRLGTCREFFQEIEKRYLKDIPVIQGELTCSWSEHAITNAWATGCYREASRRLKSWAAVEACRKDPAGDISAPWWQIMKNLVLYSDHTFGLSMWEWNKRVTSYGSLCSEVFDLPRYSWEIKTRYAEEALHQIRRLQDNQTIELSCDDTERPSTISVFNPHSFNYEGMVKFITAQESIQLLCHDGTLAEIETMSINTKWFLHKAWISGIPPYGLKVYRINEKEDKNIIGPNYISDGWVLQGPGITVRVDPETGAVSSVRTGKKQKEWVNASHSHLNQIYYFRVSEVPDYPFRGGLEDPVKQKIILLSNLKKLGSCSGFYSASLLLERSFDQPDLKMSVETQYILDRSGLKIKNLVKKIHTLSKEACYFAFPFCMDKPYRFDVEQQGQTTKFPEERLPGASNHNLGMQDFVSLSDAGSQVVWTAIQACLVTFGRPSYYHFGLDYQKIKKATIFSYVFNNLWNTNCPLLQQRDLVFEYHVAFIEHAYSPVAAYRVAKTATQPALTFPGNLEKAGFRLKKTNLLSVSSNQVLVESIRLEEKGIWQVRLVEIKREPVTCEVGLAEGRFKHFTIRNSFNSKPAWQPVANNKIVLSFRAAEFKTIELM